MQKVIAYMLISCTKVSEYLDNGWQPWGSAVTHWEGQRNVPHQPMVKYDDKV